MNPKMKGWKEGVLTQDICAVAGEPMHKGQTVRYRRYKQYTKSKLHRLSGEYEYHYLNEDNMNLIRSTILYINP
jgi:hypothetical protein